MPSATIAPSSSGRVHSVVLSRPLGDSIHAYSGRSWWTDGRLRANVVRSSFRGPMPLGSPTFECSFDDAFEPPTVVAVGKAPVIGDSESVRDTFVVVLGV